jgi:hypothetical protein
VKKFKSQMGVGAQREINAIGNSKYTVTELAGEKDRYYKRFSSRG